MRRRVVLFVSLTANLVLAGGWFFAARHQATRGGAMPQHEVTVATQTKTNVIIRRQFFSWQEVESSDYPTFIANLRDIGCPEQTIRDIIIADVNALFAKRRATEIVTADQQWWRSEPDSNVVQLAALKLRELDQQRRELLGRLLGGKWEAGDLASLPRPSRPGLILDGPVLGLLPAEVKQSVQDIVIKAQERMDAYNQAILKEGGQADPAQLVRLRQQTRSELAQVLSGSQLEEFLLRFSQNAVEFRSELGQLKHFNATPEEFRAAFRAMDPIDQQLDSLGDATDFGTTKLREGLLAQRESALKAALGTERYEQYLLMHDPTYQAAYAAAQQAGAPENAQALYEISQASAQEQARIRANTNLTAEQLAYELKKAELEQLKANALALGQDVATEPAPPPKPEPRKLHVLSAGENLAFLSRLYGVNPESLRAANPGLNLDKLKAGDTVSVPIKLLPPVPALPPQ